MDTGTPGRPTSQIIWIVNGWFFQGRSLVDQAPLANNWAG